MGVAAAGGAGEVGVDGGVAGPGVDVADSGAGGVAVAPEAGAVGSGPDAGRGSDGVAIFRPLLLGAGHTGAVERRHVAQHPGGGLHDRHRERGAGTLA